MYLLSFFYLRDEIGFRCGLFASAAPLASTFAGALAYGITNGHSQLENWRLLFLVEGLATVIMAPVAYFFIPDSPDKAKFLDHEEKEIVKSRALRQVGTEPGSRIGRLNGKEFLLTLMDYKAWFVAVCLTTTFNAKEPSSHLEAYVLWCQCQLCQFACVLTEHSERHGIREH